MSAPGRAVSGCRCRRNFLSSFAWVSSSSCWWVSLYHAHTSAGLRPIARARNGDMDGADSVRFRYGLTRRGAVAITARPVLRPRWLASAPGLTRNEKEKAEHERGVDNDGRDNIEVGALDLKRLLHNVKGVKHGVVPSSVGHSRVSD